MSKAKSLPASPRIHVFCHDGPFKGKTLSLTSDARTAWFTFRGVTGRYVNGHWHLQPQPKEAA